MYLNIYRFVSYRLTVATSISTKIAYRYGASYPSISVDSILPRVRLGYWGPFFRTSSPLKRLMVPLPLGIQIAQNRYYVHTLGPKVSITYILGSLGYYTGTIVGSGIWPQHYSSFGPVKVPCRGPQGDMGSHKPCSLFVSILGPSIALAPFFKGIRSMVPCSVCGI